MIQYYIQHSGCIRLGCVMSDLHWHFPIMDISLWRQHMESHYWPCMMGIHRWRVDYRNTMWSFDVFSVVRLSKLMNKQSNCQTPWHSREGSKVLAMFRCPGDWFNIKMPVYQYRETYCRDKTILRPSYNHNGISYTGETSLYWNSGLFFIYTLTEINVEPSLQKKFVCSSIEVLFISKSISKTTTVQLL